MNARQRFQDFFTTDSAPHARIEQKPSISWFNLRRGWPLLAFWVVLALLLGVESWLLERRTEQPDVLEALKLAARPAAQALAMAIGFAALHSSGAGFAVMAVTMVATFLAMPIYIESETASPLYVVAAGAGWSTLLIWKRAAGQVGEGLGALGVPRGPLRIPVGLVCFVTLALAVFVRSKENGNPEKLLPLACGGVAALLVILLDGEQLDPGRDTSTRKRIWRINRVFGLYRGAILTHAALFWGATRAVRKLTENTTLYSHSGVLERLGDGAIAGIILVILAAIMVPLGRDGFSLRQWVAGWLTLLFVVTLAQVIQGVSPSGKLADQNLASSSLWLPHKVFSLVFVAWSIAGAVIAAGLRRAVARDVVA